MNDTINAILSNPTFHTINGCVAIVSSGYVVTALYLNAFFPELFQRNGARRTP